MKKKRQNVLKNKKILNVLGVPIIKAPKGMDALKAREYMQTHYKRV